MNHIRLRKSYPSKWGQPELSTVDPGIFTAAGLCLPADGSPSVACNDAADVGTGEKGRLKPLIDFLKSTG